MTIPRWKLALRDVRYIFTHGPIAVGLGTLLATTGAAFALLVIVAIAGSSPGERAFDKACVLADGTVQKVEGNKFCVTLARVDSIASVTNYDWLNSMSTQEKDALYDVCAHAGGQVITEPKARSCFYITIIKELGAREDYHKE